MKTIQEMAREVEAYIAATDDFVGWSFTGGQLEAFAALVREDAQRKPLTDTEIDRLWEMWLTQKYGSVTKSEGHVFARAIEAAHGIKE